MMRGTVYTIRDDGEGNRLVTRQVVQLDDVDDADTFRQAVEASLSTFVRSSPAGRVEYGPIAPPWSRVSSS